MDIRWTYSDIAPGAGGLPPLALQALTGRYHLDLRMGAWCRFDELPTNHRHQHDGYHEFCLVAEGRGRFRHGTRVFELGPGCLFVADPGIAHEIDSHTTRDLLLAFWTLRCEDTRAPLGGDFEDRALDSFMQAHRLAIDSQQDLLDLLHLLGTPVPSAPGSRYRQEQLFRTLALTACARLAEVAVTVDDRERHGLSDRIARTMAFIDQHCDRQLAVGEVAAAVGCTERHLRRLIQESHGVRLIDLISERRFNRAAQHLLMGFGSAAAGQAIGIADPSQFARQFRQRFGCTPREYQARYARRQPPPRTTHVG